jgi:hypothetical protein
MTLTTSTVLSLAPDAASAAAAKGLAVPTSWPLLGRSARAVWGECKGSGSRPYRTQVDLSAATPTFKCSCPSRKFPCKHGLALLLLEAAAPMPQDTSEPDWIVEWLDARQVRAEKKETKAAEPPDPKAAIKREDARWKKISEGAADLDRFMADQLARGLASLSAQQLDPWRTMAARMVDAQAPALGDRLRDLADVVGAQADWPKTVLLGFGAIHLAIEAVEKRASLSNESIADLKAALGWSITTEQVLACGDLVDDEWQVLGQLSEIRNRITERRVWLRGARTARPALIIDYAAGTRVFDSAFVTGSTFASTLAFYPGTTPLRAMVSGTVGASRESGSQVSSLGLDFELAAISQMFGRNPWLRATPMTLVAATPHATTAGEPEAAWAVATATGEALPLQVGTEEAMQLLACSGGAPIDLFGEWDGSRLRPLTAWSAEGLLSMEARA